MRQLIYIINAAGGNATAIQVLEQGLNKEDYANLGKQLMDNNADFNVEQVGFLIPKDKHFEMSGGEFCGNAARAATILLCNSYEQDQIEFTMSGFPNTITGTNKKLSGTKYFTTCFFPGMPLSEQKLADQNTVIVDLGGIVHILIEDDMPEDYTEKHQELTKKYNLQERSAVGVVWFNKKNNVVTINPVVWVKDIDSFFYETSCGSGTIAAAKITGTEKIVQPSGETIEVIFNNQDVTLKSEMEIIERQYNEKS